MVHVVSGEHVFSCHERHVDSHLLVVSGELHVASRERVEGLLPVQHRLHTSGRGMCRMPSGNVQPPAGADRVLELYGGHILAELRSGEQRDVREL